MVIHKQNSVLEEKSAQTNSHTIKTVDLLLSELSERLNKKDRYLWIATMEKIVGKSWITRRTDHSAPDEVKLDCSLKALIMTWTPDMNICILGRHWGLEKSKAVEDRLTKSKLARYYHWWHKQEFTNLREAVIDRKSGWNNVLQIINSQKRLNKQKNKNLLR